NDLIGAQGDAAEEMAGRFRRGAHPVGIADRRAGGASLETQGRLGFLDRLGAHRSAALASGNFGKWDREQAPEQFRRRNCSLNEVPPWPWDMRSREPTHVGGRHMSGPTGPVRDSSLQDR